MRSPVQVCGLGSHTRASSIREARAPLHTARNSLTLNLSRFFFIQKFFLVLFFSFFYFSAISTSSLAASAPVSLNMTASVCTTRVLSLRRGMREEDMQSHKNEKSFMRLPLEKAMSKCVSWNSIISILTSMKRDEIKIEKNKKTQP